MNNYTPETHKYVAIDFDNTITKEDCYPELGTPKPYAIATINKMIDQGYEIAIWTSRGSEENNPLIMKQLSEWGLNTDKVIINEHFPYFLGAYDSRSPKIYADVYIDDKAYGITEIDWKEISNSFLGYLETFKTIIDDSTGSKGYIVV